MSDLSCALCTRSFSSSNALTQHRRSHPETVCDVCGRAFVSARAVEQHTAASHPPLFECPTCDKCFRSASARDQHSATHPATFACAHCSKMFASEGGRDMHQRAVHKAANEDESEEEKKEADEEEEEGSVDDWRPAAPIPTPGYWIARADFPGDKSFGYFSCDACSNSWLSAHAFKHYRQGCKACEDKSLPTWMWVNLPRDDDDDERSASGKQDKPHHQSRCDACKAGICLA